LSNYSQPKIQLETNKDTKIHWPISFPVMFYAILSPKNKLMTSMEWHGMLRRITVTNLCTCVSAGWIDV